MQPARKPPSPPLSAVIITRDSAATLDATLAALDWCDEIVVVDSGSRDATLDIARRHGARMLHRDFDGYGSQKRFAALQARNDWVLLVDSDEVVTEALRDEIVALFADGEPPAAGYYIAISLVFLGRLLRFGGEYDKTHLRLWDRRRGNYDLASVHEQVEVDGPTTRLRERMLHYSYRSVEHYLEKLNQYTSLAARDMLAQGKRAPLWHIVLRTPVSFFRLYVLRGLALDGYPGFVWSLFSALYPTIKFIKLRELRAAAAEARDATRAASLGPDGASRAA